MSLYAIGDLHLSLGGDKPMDVFGGGWTNYIEKIREGFAGLSPDDVCVLCGDTSWGMSPETSLADFKFLASLPGRKIILKGNHDYWWATNAKLTAFFEKNSISGVEILNNNCYYYEGVAICGTRGWISDENESGEYDKKIMAREVIRLGISLRAAADAQEKLCFFHYPPRFNNVVCEDIIAVMREHGVRRCWYGHLHGTGHRYAVTGDVEGIEYSLVSADYIGFKPVKVL